MTDGTNQLRSHTCTSTNVICTGEPYNLIFYACFAFLSKLRNSSSTPGPSLQENHREGVSLHYN